MYPSTWTAWLSRSNNGVLRGSGPSVAVRLMDALPVVYRCSRVVRRGNIARAIHRRRAPAGKSVILSIGNDRQLQARIKVDSLNLTRDSSWLNTPSNFTSLQWRRKRDTKHPCLCHIVTITTVIPQQPREYYMRTRKASITSMNVFQDNII